eukprot:6051892-Pyramimonas_sp.AAC.1
MATPRAAGGGAPSWTTTCSKAIQATIAARGAARACSKATSNSAWRATTSPTNRGGGPGSPSAPPSA